MPLIISENLAYQNTDVVDDEAIKSKQSSEILCCSQKLPHLPDGFIIFFIRKITT